MCGARALGRGCGFGSAIPGVASARIDRAQQCRCSRRQKLRVGERVEVGNRGSRETGAGNPEEGQRGEKTKANEAPRHLSLQDSINS